MKSIENNKLSNKERHLQSLKIAHEAIEYYLSNKSISLTKLAIKFGTTRTTLYHYMKNYNIAVRDMSKKYFYDKDFFNLINTEEKAYWLGFIYADGYISKDNHLEITLNSGDKQHLYKFRQAIKSNVPIKTKWVTLNGKRYKACRINVCCTKMCKDLIKQGVFNNKSLNIQFPKIFRANLIRHFIRGYVDGNGCLSTRNMVYISCGSKLFLESLQKVLIKKLDLTKVKIYSDKRSKNYAYAKVGEQGKLIRKYLYKDCKIYLDRKYCKVLPILTQLPLESKKV
jgi:hypothetical protein